MERKQLLCTSERNVSWGSPGESSMKLPPTTELPAILLPGQSPKETVISVGTPAPAHHSVIHNS